MTADAITGTYDAENRMTSAWDSSGGISYYTYNANGQRVRRKVGGVETWQIYGFDGELLAEYAADDPDTSPQKEYGYCNGQLLITAEPSSSTNTPAYNGSTADIPGTVQIENFDDGGEGSAYHDTTSGSHGQDYDQSPTNPTPSFRQRFSTRPTLEQVFAGAKDIDPELERRFDGKLNQDKTPSRIYEAYWDHQYSIREIAEFLNQTEESIEQELDEYDDRF